MYLLRLCATVRIDQRQNQVRELFFDQIEISVQGIPILSRRPCHVLCVQISLRDLPLRVEFACDTASTLTLHLV